MQIGYTCIGCKEFTNRIKIAYIIPQVRLINGKVICKPDINIPKIIAAKQQSLLFIINGKLALSADRQNWLLQKRSHANEAAEQKLIRIAYAGAVIIMMFIGVLLWQLNKDIRRRKKAEKEINTGQTIKTTGFL